MAMLRGLTDSKLRADVIDLDPYGSAAPFLDAAVQVCVCTCVSVCVRARLL